MADEILKRDQNNEPVIGAVTDDTAQEIRMGRIDDSTKGLKVMLVGGVGSGSVTDVSVVTANGISGTVTTPTSTPAITLALGVITPTSVNGLTLASQAVGFTIAGGTTSKTLTMSLDASVSGTNTGDNATNSQYSGLAGSKLDVSAKATKAEVATGTDDVKYTTPLAVAPYANNSIYRQAIINGNFDVWQRGTSFTGAGWLADRWYATTGTAGRTITRELIVLDGSNYCMRVARDSGNTNTTTNYYVYGGLESSEGIKFQNKIVTLSFWARCGANFSPTNSLLEVQVKSGTGTNESFTGASYATGNATVINQAATLTTTWQKFTYTSSTLGSTVNQFSVLLGFVPVGTAGVDDWFDITQIQINVGSVALPFMPKSYADELRDCQRYYENGRFAQIFGYTWAANTLVRPTLYYKVPKRTTSPTITFNDVNGNTSKIYRNSVNITATVYNTGINTLQLTCSAGNGSSYEDIVFDWTSDAEL